MTKFLIGIDIPWFSARILFPSHGYPIKETVAVALHAVDELLGNLAGVFYERHIKDDEFAKAEEVEHADLVAGKLDPQLMNAVLQQIRIGPWQGGPHFLQQG